MRIISTRTYKAVAEGKITVGWSGTSAPGECFTGERFTLRVKGLRYADNGKEEVFTVDLTLNEAIQAVEFWSKQLDKPLSLDALKRL